MDRGRTRLPGDTGFVTVQYVAATGLALVFLVMIVQVVSFQFTRALVATAVADGARAAARDAGSTSTCEQAGHDVLAGLLAPAAATVAFSCTSDGTVVVAEATATLRAWVPMLQDWEIREWTRVPIEPAA